MKTVAIIGLGYVGLPLACLCARKGLRVVGLEKNSRIIEKTNKGESHIKDDKLIKEVAECKGRIKATGDAAELNKADVIIVCVPTPVDKNHMPDLSYVRHSAEDISKNLRHGQLIVIESTIHPGTVEEIVKPIMDNSGLADGDGYFLAHCPERIDPGNKKWTVENLPRVVGGTTKKGAEMAAAFYRSIISGQVTELSSVKAAEAVKIMENSFRDINIAFINEMAKSFDIANIDILEAIRGASTKPFAFMPHYPGAGVGGHCIPVDPYYLIEKAKSAGFEHRFLSLAREINNSMPFYTIELLEYELKKLGKKISGAKIGILGVAYKKDIDDIRESPALEIIHELKQKGAELFIYDPNVPGHSNCQGVQEALEKSDYIVLATDHLQFKSISPDMLKQEKIAVVIDGRNCLDMEGIKKKGIAYRGIGRK